MKLVLGVDGGNTKTLALVAREDGAILGAGRAGCGDIYGATSPTAAIAEIQRAVHAALIEAKIVPGQISAGAFSLAGADWPEDFHLLEEAMRAKGYGQQIVIVNDAMGALRAGSPDGTGVVVACGTGAAVGARGMDDRIWHSSFWQQTQGADELSQRALRAVYHAELGIDPPTLLTERLLAIFEVQRVEELLHQLTARDIPRSEKRRQLVRPLFECADAGDAVARQILLSHGRALGHYAIIAARKVGLLEESFPLVLTGGVLRHPSPFLREALLGCVREAAPGMRAIQSRFEPAAGAVLLALDVLSIQSDATLLEQLEKTFPDVTFFAT
jgi:N-acetylglucosamine kinase-like BadF-type ATPase